MSDADWFYHLTTKEIARKIKSNGMSPAVARIGMPVANPKGAFAQNRDKMQGVKNEQKLTAYLADMLSRGASLDTIKGQKGQYKPFTFNPQGSNAADYPRLDDIEKTALSVYAKAVKATGKPNFGKIRQFRQDSKVKQLAATMLRSDKNHFLSRLAVQYVAFSYKIEETITASHVYFLNPKYAVDGYNEYKKHLSSSDIVVLRVHKDNLKSLVQDDADYRALKTKETVAPDGIEVMVNHQSFTSMDYRCDAQNWQSLKNWV